MVFVLIFEIPAKDSDATWAPHVDEMALPVEAPSVEAPVGETDVPVPVGPCLEELEEVLVEELVDKNPMEPAEKRVGIPVQVTVQVPLKEAWGCKVLLTM